MMYPRLSWALNGEWRRAVERGGLTAPILGTPRMIVLGAVAFPARVPVCMVYGAGRDDHLPVSRLHMEFSWRYMVAQASHVSAFDGLYPAGLSTEPQIWACQWIPLSRGSTTG